MRRLLWPTVLAHVVPAVAWGLLAELVFRRTAPMVVIGVLVLVVGVVMFVPRTNVYLRGERRSLVQVALVDVPYFVHWTAGLLMVPIVLVAIAVELGVRAARGDLAFPRWAFIGSYVLGCAIATYGALVRRRVTKTLRIEVPIEGLDPSFDGYRIAHLSDMHISSWTPRSWGMRWARAANALGCDLAVVTGDMVANGTGFHQDIADVIGALRARDGVVACMGNHDYFGNAEPLVSMIEGAGARLLRNESVRITRDGAHLHLAAIDDRWSRRSNMGDALRDCDTGAPVILLAHDPVDFPAAAANEVDLVLSGHTHGGQIALPFFARHLNLSMLSRKYTLGVYRSGKSQLIVHPGLGTSGPPVRVGVAPAIVEITLRSSAGHESLGSSMQYARHDLAVPAPLV